MREYALSTELVRFGFVIGIVVSMLLYERFHVTTGSVVVPGYVAAFFYRPLVLLVTAGTALLCAGLVTQVLPRLQVRLQGRARFSALAITSHVLQGFLVEVRRLPSAIVGTRFGDVVGAGYIIPALIAHDLPRQGSRKTLTAIAVASGLAAIPVFALSHLAAPFTSSNVGDAPTARELLTLVPIQWFPLMVVCSTLIAFGLNDRHGLRSGGFVSGAYVALLAVDVWQVAYLFALALLSWLIVTRLLTRHMILFGRRKFAAMLLVSSLLGWSASAFTGLSFGPLHLPAWYGGLLVLMPLFLPGLLANDMERTSPARVLVGTGIVAIITFAAVRLIIEVTTGRRIFEIGLLAALLVTLVVAIAFTSRAAEELPEPLPGIDPRTDDPPTRERVG